MPRWSPDPIKWACTGVKLTDLTVGTLRGTQLAARFQPWGLVGDGGGGTPDSGLTMANIRWKALVI